MCAVIATFGRQQPGIRFDLDLTDRVVGVATTAGSGDFLLSSAAAGLGVTLLPTFIAGEAIAAGKPAPVLRDDRWPVTPAWALYRPARQLSARVRAFIDYLAGHFAGTPHWDTDCENSRSLQTNRAGDGRRMR